MANPKTVSGYSTLAAASEPRIRLGGCVIAHTLRSTHLPTLLRSDEEVMTALQLVDEVRTMTDAEQWLVVLAVALLVVAFTGYVGLAVVLVGRTIVSIGRQAAAWPRYWSRRVTIKMPNGDPLTTPPLTTPR
jgi:hypothetical protein